MIKNKHQREFFLVFINRNMNRNINIINAFIFDKSSLDAYFSFRTVNLKLKQVRRIMSR